MKSIKNLIIKANLHRILRTSFFAFILIVFISCDEKEFLKEVPLDFYSAETSFVTYKDFESALANFYYRVRADFGGQDQNCWHCPLVMWSGTDLINSDFQINFSPNYQAYISPTFSPMVYEAVWKPAYQIIYDANVIIGRADSESSKLSDQEKILVKAEAMFFRAYAYRMLAHLYGGVPIVLEEITSPRRDYVRATRNEVYELCVSDLKFAAENLPDIDEVDDSRVNKLAAYHYLSEVYICLQRWPEAIDAATAVITHPRMALMTERFGTRKNDPDFGGDVYWDLFRGGNQNRSTGNKEAIWVSQWGFQVPGGGGGNLFERCLVPRLWQATIKNNNGKLVTLIPSVNTFYYGCSSGFQRASNYFYWTVWQKSGYYQDIRNSQYNIVRDFKVNNPASDFNGKWVIKDKLPISRKTATDTLRNFFPVVAKSSDPGKHPLEFYLPDQTVPGSLIFGTRNTTDQDVYIIRLAETYLLRSEAYLGAGDKIKAAEDINSVRRRAHAPDVNPSEVNIDYILDERMRELHFEEFRLLTLTRLGKYVERVKACNPSIGATLLDHNNLWPIPFDEIEKNVEAVLEQNPGY